MVKIKKKRAIKSIVSCRRCLRRNEDWEKERWKSNGWKTATIVLWRSISYFDVAPISLSFFSPVKNAIADSEFCSCDFFQFCASIKVTQAREYIQVYRNSNYSLEPWKARWNFQSNPSLFKLLFNSNETLLRERSRVQRIENWELRARNILIPQLLSGRGRTDGANGEEGAKHYKSGIRVSQRAEWPAAGIKMTSGRVHVLLPWMAGGIEQKDRRRRRRGSERGWCVVGQFAAASNSCNSVATGISALSCTVHGCARLHVCHVHTHVYALVCASIGLVHRSRWCAFGNARPRRAFYSAGPNGTGSMRFIAPERLQQLGPDNADGEGDGSER